MFNDEVGLSSAEVTKLRQQFGPNILPEKPEPGDFSIFISQFKNPLVYVLLFAGLTTLIQKDLPDTLIITASVLLNVILGFFQERKANRSLQALKRFVTQTVEVLRDQKRQKIESTQLVVGDVVILGQGTKVPADGDLISTNRLYVDESILTGESLPQTKSLNAHVFMGTLISSGQAVMRVTKTGASTRIGTIALDIQDTKEETPLGRQLRIFSKKLVVLTLVLIVFVFLLGLFRGNSVSEMFTTAIALAVACVPEGLLVSLTVVLAVGMQRILARKGLVRKLASAETLGGVSVICVDKTGTLTQGKMQVINVLGDEKDLAKQVLLANDLDDPLVIAAFEWGRGKIKDFIEKHSRLDSIPFSSKHKFFISLHKWTKTENMVFVNGAPDVLLPWVNLGQKEKQLITDQINEATSQGRRVIGFARKIVSSRQVDLTHNDAKSNLEWIGVLGLSDPVRPSVKDALALATEAGIRTIVITGDYPNTSEYVLAELGITLTKDEIVTGDMLEKMTPSQLSEKVKTIKLFARTSPEQKLKIVEALKLNHETVAMMGDGVNDAPAIHKADIGIAVSEASDVARESADLVLIDSNFATIISAVEEGRGIFDNIRKIILYLLSDAFAGIIIIIGGIILGLPLPLTAIQIIWINLISDGIPNLALTIDPKRPGIMNEKPRRSEEQLVSRWMIFLIGTVSTVAGLFVLAVFTITYEITKDLDFARSLSFITLGMSSLAYVFSVRTLMVPFWESNLFGNKWLIVSVFAGSLLQTVPFLTGSTRNFFDVVALEPFHWAIAIALSISPFFVIEIFKLFYKTSLGQKLLK